MIKYMNWKEKTDLVLDRIEKGRKEIEHPGVNHHRFLIPTRRKQRHTTYAFQRHHLTPTWIRPAGHLNAGESYIHDASDTLHHKTAEGSGGGVCLTAQPPRFRQERCRNQERCQHLAALKSATKQIIINSKTLDVLEFWFWFIYDILLKMNEWVENQTERRVRTYGEASLAAME